jgi:hypothetical protein
VVTIESAAMEPPAVFVDRIDRLVPVNRPRRHYIRISIIQNVGCAIDVDREHGVVDPQVKILQHDDAHIVGGDAEVSKHHVLGDRVIPQRRRLRRNSNGVA